MSEKKNNNDQFSELFKREGAEFDIPYREEDWLKLEKKLDLRDAKIAYRRKVAVIAAAAVLILSFLGYFTYENYENINQLNKALEDQIIHNDSAQDSNSSGENIASDQLKNGQTNLTESSESNDNTQTSLSDSRGSDETGEPSISVSDDIAAGFEDMESEQAGILACDTCLTSEFSSRIVVASSLQNGSNSESITRNSQLQMSATQNSPNFLFESDDQAPKNGSGFSLSLKAAPDLSTIDGFSNFQNPGYSIGFDVGYQINERISVSTGMSRSLVRYQGAEGGYKPPDYLTEGVIPDQITGECVLLDIPLTVKYNILEFSRSRIFATAGVSTYIMLNEEYDFSYKNQYQDDDSYSYNGKTGTAHWMSNAGISIGMEVDIHPSWSLRAEPQIKLPLRNVGISNVRLYSLGSFISLSYKF